MRQARDQNDTYDDPRKAISHNADTLVQVSLLCLGAYSLKKGLSDQGFKV
jgi:hypothetical protein